MTLYEQIKARIAELEVKKMAASNGSAILVFDSAIQTLQWVLEIMTVDEASIKGQDDQALLFMDFI